jgi:hypothetical protein
MPAVATIHAVRSLWPPVVVQENTAGGCCSAPVSIVLQQHPAAGVFPAVGHQGVSHWAMQSTCKKPLASGTGPDPWTERGNVLRARSFNQRHAKAPF